MTVEHASDTPAPRFEDRRAAGRELAREIESRGGEIHTVIGLTPGGVPVAFEAADAVGLPMDILVVRHLHAPDRPELVLGAVTADGSSAVLDDGTLRSAGTGLDDLPQELEARMVQAREDDLRYRHGNPPLDLFAKSVVVVDDALMTGAAVQAAIASLRGQGAERIVVASPVGTRSAVEVLAREADEVICLEVSDEVSEISRLYGDFSPVDDDEITHLLDTEIADRRGHQSFGSDFA